MTIVVVNKRHGGKGQYVGRPTVLGNPFVIGRDGSREEVIEKYRVWLARMLEADSHAAREFRRLRALYKEQGSLTLVCWCAPLPCHADVIAEEIEKLG